MILSSLLISALLAQSAPGKTTAPKTAAPKSATPKTTPAATKTAAPKTVPAKSSPKSAVKTPLPSKSMTAVTFNNDDEKIIYSIGLSIHRSLGQFQLTPAEVEVLTRAIVDASKNQPAVKIEEWGPKIQSLAQARQAVVAQQAKAESAAYLEKAAQEPGAVKTETGLVYKQLTPGSGASPKASDTVKVHYRGTLTNGTEFDSSYKRGEPATFPLSGVVPCWTEGVQKMKVGEKAMLVCPSNLAYGESGQGPIPGGAALIFEIELLDIVQK